MLYLKYRPQTIAEIDSVAVREKLGNLLEAKTPSHAFLLTGSRGTGKTSSARVIAKSLNCEENARAGKGNSFEPCNKCDTCKSITRGVASDVFELDAASHRKIDDIRDLIEGVAYSPVSCRFKVYIIDEVHMLTREAASALLKTLEEPPAHAVFVLATTDKEALPSTIISRCINIEFGKAQEQELVSMMKRIAKQEAIKVDEELLALIARHAEGSFRDGVKLLEQAIEQKALTAEEFNKITGSLKSELAFLKLLQKKEQKEALTFLEELDQAGGSFKVLTEDLLDSLHRLLLSKNGIKTGLLEELDFSIKEIAILMKLLIKAYEDLKISPIESVPLSIVVIEYCEQ